MHANKDIRNYALVRDVRLWQIADALGICDSNFSRKLRRELSMEEKAKIRLIVDNLAKERTVV